VREGDLGRRRGGGEKIEGRVVETGSWMEGDLDGGRVGERKGRVVESEESREFGE